MVGRLLAAVALAMLSGATVLAGSPGEPFALTHVGAGWPQIERSIEEDGRELGACEVDRVVCSPAAARLLSIISEAGGQTGLARLGVINRAITLWLRPTEQGAWRAPLKVMADGAGDCKGHSVVAFLALREAGVPARDLRIVVVSVPRTGEEHAVVAVRFADEWIILDSNRLNLLRDRDVVDYRPLYVLK